ncbi:MAG: hypothetical protein ABJB86_16875 [Bacteroidota bacterium]
MLAKNEVTKIYETILSIPGMNDQIKIVITIPRKNVLFLSKAIERGITIKDPDEKTPNVLDMVPKDDLKELVTLATDMLEKAGLTSMNQKLNTF